MSKTPFIFLLISLISLSSPIIVHIEPLKTSYCFEKTIYEEDEITVSFIVSSDRSENLKTKFFNVGSKEILYQTNNLEQSGQYKPEKPLPSGRYSFCLYPQEKSTYLVSLDFYSFLDGGMYKDLAKDDEVKQMKTQISEIKTVFNEIEKNLKFSLDRKITHTTILSDIIDSVKYLTILKIGIVGLLSVFQICIIQRFFGKDKRVSTVKGAFSDGL